MSSMNEDRQHPATHARLKRAREEGDVAHSHELATAIQMVAGVGALWFCAAAIGEGLSHKTISLWSASSISASPESILQSSQSLIWVALKLVLPFLVAIFVVGTFAHMLQTRFLIKRPDVSTTNIGPRRWFGNVFSSTGVSQFLIATPKAAVALSVGVFTVWINRNAIFSLGGMPTNLLGVTILRLTAMVGMSVAITLLFCSGLDYLLHWYNFHRRNRMTDQELREEIRGQTGDPQIARIRHQRMREISRE